MCLCFNSSNGAAAGPGDNESSLLRKEVASLNQEMSQVLKRAKDSERGECTGCQQDVVETVISFTSSSPLFLQAGPGIMKGLMFDTCFRALSVGCSE